VHGGETLKRLPVEKGDIVLCDRGYSHREGVAQVLRQEADVVVRLNSGAFPLEDQQGQGVDLVKLVEKLKVGQIGEWRVWFQHGGQRHQMRLCVLRKSQLATQRAQRKAERKARDKGQQVRPETLKLAAFVLVLTSLPASWGAAELILELYRARWQVELAFKRLKQLLSAGHVPKTTDESARAWLQAKVLTALLIEHMIHAGRFFPPGATGCSEERRWQVFKEVRDSVIGVLQMPLTLRHLLRRGPIIAKAFRECRPKRPRQMEKLNKLLNC
jgi:hypothetical protein